MMFRAELWPMFPAFVSEKQGVMKAIRWSGRVRGNLPPQRLPSQIHAAGDLDALPVDPAVFLGEQRGDHRSDVVRETRAAEGCHVGDALVDLGIVADHA